MTIQRFYINALEEPFNHDAECCDDGNVVLYTDHAAAIAALEQRVKECEAERDAAIADRNMYDAAHKTQSRKTLELSAKLARMEWTPFDTAPTNGQEVLVYRKDAGVFMASFRPSAGDDGEFGPQMNGEECWFDNYGGDLTGELPSHWMPTPDEPEEEAPHA